MYVTTSEMMVLTGAWKKALADETTEWYGRHCEEHAQFTQFRLDAKRAVREIRERYQLSKTLETR